MLVLDDSKMRLLKMKERLLEISRGMDKTALDDYKKLATELDFEVYTKLLDKIKKNRTHNLSLEEQLVFLSDVEKDYNDLYELRCGYEFTYAKYSQEKLELSDLSNILIDNIKNRKSVVEGYLINVQNIESIKKELEKLNYKLIQAGNKEDEIQRKLKQLETELRNNVLNAEGRIYSDIGSLKYTSIVQEFRDNSLELKELLDNKELLDEEFNRINEKEVASSEKLQAAKICYQNMPSGENLEVYRLIDTDAAKVRYKLVLLRIAALVAEEAENYNQAVDKRMEITSLNGVRLNCLQKLGINVSIDSFSRIRLKEQLDIIKSLGDNSQEIANIRKSIDNYNTLIEERMRQNNEFMLNVNDDVEFIRDDTSFTNMALNSEVEIPKTVDFEDHNYLNKVVKVDNVSNMFMIDRAIQKTQGVIKRVNEVYNGVTVEEDKEPTNPELLVVPSEEPVEEIADTLEPKEEVTFTESDVFPEISLNDTTLEEDKTEEVPNDIFVNTEPAVTDIFTTFDENNKTAETKDDVFINEPASVTDGMFSTFDGNNATEDTADDVFVDDKKTDTLFNDAVPFESVPLFSDRYDDGVFAPKEEKPAVNTPITVLPEAPQEPEIFVDNNEVDNSGGVSEVFWPTQEAVQPSVTPAQENTPLSFDEQIKALINDDQGKVRRKVA